MSSFFFRPRSNRGSVLIVALLFAALIAIALASYLSLANNSLKQASRSFYASSGVNLAETGLEQAIACFNQLAVSAPAVAWTGWTLDSTPYDATTSPLTPAATRTFTGFTPGPSATGTIKVFAQHYPGITPTNTPKIVAQSTITQDNAPPIHKFIEVVLRKRLKFGSGLTSIQDVTSTGGNITVKSWDSDPDNNPSTAAIPYSVSVMTANATVASVTGNIGLGGSTDIAGYAAVSTGHTITAGTVHALGSTFDDPDRRTYDYDGQFPTEPVPAYSSNPITAHVNSTTVFPRSGDFSVSVGGKLVYYYNLGSFDINLGGSGENIQIQTGQNVVFIQNNIGQIKTAGGGYIQILSGATLEIYTSGNVDLAGAGLLNDNFSAATFRLYGTGSTSQTIKVAGTSEFRGVIYAPNAAITAKGGGSNGRLIGGIVGRTINFNGNTEFIFDESLNDITRPNYGIGKWKELQLESERAVYGSALSF